MPVPQTNTFSAPSFLDLLRRRQSQGPDIQPMPIQQPQFAPMPAPPSDNSLGTALGEFAGRVGGRMIFPPGPDQDDKDPPLVKAAASGLSRVGSSVGHFLGFEKGGTWEDLRKALERKPVVVGEQGPELLTAKGVLPNDQTNQLLQRIKDVPLTQGTPQVQTTPPFNSPALDVSMNALGDRLSRQYQQQMGGQGQSGASSIQSIAPPQGDGSFDKSAVPSLLDRLKQVSLNNNGAWDERSGIPSVDSVIRPNPFQRQQAVQPVVNSSAGSEPPIMRFNNQPQPTVNSSAANVQPPILARPALSPQDQQDAPPRLVKPIQQDASVLPVNARQAAIQQAGDSNSSIVPNRITLEQPDQTTTPLGVKADTTQATTNPRQEYYERQTAAAEQRRQQLEDQYAKLLNLQNTKAVDKNGRLKSGFLGALRGFLSGGIVGAAEGGIYGAVHPQWDEELKQTKQILKQRDKLGAALAIEKELGQLDEMQARIDALRVKSSPDAQDAKSTRDMLGELRRRMIISGGKLNPRDPRAMELAEKLGIDTSPSGDDKRRYNRQSVFASGNDLVYIDPKYGTHIVLYRSNGMTDAERRRQAIDIARLNEQRNRDGLGPLDFPEDSYSVDTPQEPQPASSAAPSPVSNTTSAPQPTQQPSSAVPRLQPIPGAKPEPVVRPSYRGRGRSYSRGSSGQSKSQEIATTTGLSAVRDVEGLRSQANAARSRGEDDLANQYDSSADRLINSTVQGRGGVVDVMTLPDGRRTLQLKGAQSSAAPVLSRRNPMQGVVPIVGGMNNQTQQPSKGRVTRANFRKNNPSFRRQSDAAVDAAIRSDGYTPVP